MEIKTEKILDPLIDGVGGEIVEKAIKKLTELCDKIEEKIPTDFVPLFDKLIRNLTGEKKALVFGKTVETLDMATMVEFAKSNIVPNSNEIVVMKTMDGDEYLIYLAYSKNRELLPVESNKYLIIKSKGLSKEVEDLFGQSQLVILK